MKKAGRQVVQFLFKETQDHWICQNPFGPWDLIDQ